ncbi:unnamed protein product [Durusdinium trenchii]|uniref:Uncharacterized protein n=1 Tax=Durusdinium trenchii TaxID=1381693 RepID=A0ABP0M168_9DINO
MALAPKITPFTFEDVEKLFAGFLAVYGIAEMSNRSQFQHENIRELLKKLAVVWADSPTQLQMCLETMQILTMLANMSFKVQMDGEGVLGSGVLKTSAWVEATDIIPLPRPTTPAPLRTKLTSMLRIPDMKAIVLNELEMALNDLQTLLNHAEVVPQIFYRFQAVSAMLDDVNTVARTM